MTEDDKGKEKVEALLAESEAKVREAMEVADEYHIMFVHEPAHVGVYHGKGYDGEDGYLYGDTVAEQGAWFPSEWNSSNLYC